MKEIIVKNVSEGANDVVRRKKLNLYLIREKRKKLGFTYQKMADELSFKNASTYYKYEKGAYAFKADHVPILAAVLDIRIQDLFF